MSYPQVETDLFRWGLGPDSLRRVGGDAERRLGDVARRQGGVFRRADAEAAGLSKNTIAARMRAGIWVSEFGTGLRAATTPPSVDGRDRAALARIGDDAVLSHLSAAWRWGLCVDPPVQVWVTVARPRMPRPVAGIRIVRSKHLPSSAVRIVGGLPVLSAARTVADLALVWDVSQLTAAALNVIQRGIGDLDAMRRWHQRLMGRAGSADLGQALLEVDPRFESILAAEFGALASAAGLDLIPGYRLRLPDGSEVVCDFADPIARIDYEVDGLAYHSSPAQVARDKARDRRLLAAGWVTVRYGTHDIRRTPQRTVADAREQQALRRPQR